MTDERPWLTLTEAVALTGLNRETLRSRARRGLIPHRRGNAGNMLVQIDRGMTGDDRDATAPDRGMTDAVTELQEEVTELRDRLARSEAAREKAEEVAAAKVAAKEEVIAELRALLADARRPWWRKLLG
jgi:hypothetical protein